jgi:hypothetical protein
LVIGLAIVALVGTIALLIAAFEEIKSHTPEAKM